MNRLNESAREELWQEMDYVNGRKYFGDLETQVQTTTETEIVIVDNGFTPHLHYRLRDEFLAHNRNRRESHRHHISFRPLDEDTGLHAIASLYRLSTNLIKEWRKV